MSFSLSFSKAIMVVIFISDKIRQEQFEYLSTKHIAEVLNIPKPTLVKILQSLTMAGMIETKEGKSGGIRLRKMPKDITVLDVLNAVEAGKPLFHTDFALKAEGKRPNKAQTILRSLFDQADIGMRNALGSKTIEEILMEMGE